MTEADGLTEELKASVRKEAITQVAKWTVGAVVLLFGLATTGWWLYLKNSLDQYIISKVEGVPSAAVVAFDLSDGCPRGWTAFQDGAGRVIVGTGQGSGLAQRKYRESSGAESVALTINNIPQHQHETLVGVVNQNPWGNGPAKPAVVGRDFQVFATAMSGFVGKNPPDTISTMPPYIALVLCKRNI